MTKRTANIASTSDDELKRSKCGSIFEDDYEVDIQSKTPNDGYKTAPEILAQRIAERVGAKWAEIVWDLKKEEPTGTLKQTKTTKQSAPKPAEQPLPAGRHSDLHSMSTEQLQEIHMNLKNELQRLVAENQRIRAYAKEKFNLDDL